jgi:aconitate hydratase
MPAGARVLPLRSNIPAIAEFCFSRLDAGFPARAKEAAATAGGGFVIAGENYGQGSSREHAALAPMYLGVRSVVALSFARIHRANLVNYGILPLTADKTALDQIDANDTLELTGLLGVLGGSGTEFTALNKTKGRRIELALDASRRERDVLLAGGLIPYTKAHAAH